MDTKSAHSSNTIDYDDYYYSDCDNNGDNNDDICYIGDNVEKITNMIKQIIAKITTMTTNNDAILAVYELIEIVESYLPDHHIYKKVLEKCEYIMLKFSIDMCDEFSESITTLIDTTSKLV